MDFGYPVLTSLIVFPLVAAAGLFLIKSPQVARAYTMGASILELIIAIPLFTFKMNADWQFVEKVAWVPQWGLQYYLAIDGISYLMVMLSLFILPLCVMCSWTYISKRVKEFHFCLLFMTSACVGVFAAMDLVLFYVFWEAMLIPMYLLIAVWGGDQRRYASLKFFLFTLAGSTLLLAAIVAFRITGGTFAIPDLMQMTFSFKFQFWCFLAMALAFAIKVPMFPFHTWLPAAHVQAPSAGSVILAAVLLKMGTYGFLRFCLPLTPAASEYFAPMMIAISVASILYGGAIALGQSDIKKLVAYSSVGHMGFVTLGIFLFNIRGVEGAIFQMLNHGIITGALFMMIGAVYERSHSRAIEDNMGMGKYMPAYMGFWGLYALASFGFPGTNGFVGEMLVFTGAFQQSYIVGALLVPGALLGAAYMFRVSLKMAWGRPSTAKKWKDLNTREWAYLLIPAVFVFYIGLAPKLFFNLIDPSVEKLVSDYKARSKVTEPAPKVAAAPVVVAVAEAPATEAAPEAAPAAPAVPAAPVTGAAGGAHAQPVNQ